MSATGRLTHRQIARRANRAPARYLDQRTGELTEAGETWAEELRDWPEARAEAAWFWADERNRYWAPMTDDGRVMA